MQLLKIILDTKVEGISGTWGAREGDGGEPGTDTLYTTRKCHNKTQYYA